MSPSPLHQRSYIGPVVVDTKPTEDGCFTLIAELIPKEKVGNCLTGRVTMIIGTYPKLVKSTSGFETNKES